MASSPLIGDDSSVGLTFGRALGTGYTDIASTYPQSFVSTMDLDSRSKTYNALMGNQGVNIFVGKGSDMAKLRDTRLTGYDPKGFVFGYATSGEMWTDARNFSAYAHIKIALGMDSKGNAKEAIISTANMTGSGLAENSRVDNAASAWRHGSGVLTGARDAVKALFTDPVGQYNFEVRSKDKAFVDQVASVRDWLVSGKYPTKELANIWVSGRDAKGNALVDYESRLAGLIGQTHKGEKISIGSPNLSSKVVLDALSAATRRGVQVDVYTNENSPIKGEQNTLATLNSYRQQGAFSLHLIKNSGFNSYLHANMALIGDYAYLGSMRFNHALMSGIGATDIAFVMKGNKSLTEAIRAQFESLPVSQMMPLIKEAKLKQTAFKAGLDQFARPYSDESFNPMRYSIDPTVYKSARDYVLRAQGDMQAFEVQRGMGEALYLSIYNQRADRDGEPGAIPWQVRMFDKGMQKRTLGQAWERMPWGVQIGNRGPLDTALERLGDIADSRLDPNNSHTPGKHGTIATALLSGYDLTANVISNIAGYYWVSIPLMSIRSATHDFFVSAEKRLDAKFSDSVVIKYKGEGLLARIDKASMRLTGMLIRDVLLPITNTIPFGEEISEATLRAASTFLNHEYIKVDGTTRSGISHFARSHAEGIKTLSAPDGVFDKAVQRVLPPLSSEGLGAPFKHFGPKFLANQMSESSRLLSVVVGRSLTKTGYYGALAAGALLFGALPGYLSDSPTYMALATVAITGVGATIAKMGYVSFFNDFKSQAHQMFDGVNVLAPDSAQTVRDLRSNLFKNKALLTRAQRIAIRAYALNPAHADQFEFESKAIWGIANDIERMATGKFTDRAGAALNHYMSTYRAAWSAYTGVNRKELYRQGLAGKRVGIFAITALVMGNQILGNLMARSRSTVGEQRTFEDFINGPEGLNHNSGVSPIQVNITAGLPGWDSQWEDKVERTLAGHDMVNAIIGGAVGGAMAIPATATLSRMFMAIAPEQRSFVTHRRAHRWVANKLPTGLGAALGGRPRMLTLGIKGFPRIPRFGLGVAAGVYLGAGYGAAKIAGAYGLVGAMSVGAISESLYSFGANTYRGFSDLISKKPAYETRPMGPLGASRALASMYGLEAAKRDVGKADSINAAKYLIESYTAAQNQLEASGNVASSYSLQFTPMPSIMTLTWSANMLHGTEKYAFTIQGPVALAGGIGVTMPFEYAPVPIPGAELTTQKTGRFDPRSYHYSPNSSLEAMVQVYAGLRTAQLIGQGAGWAAQRMFKGRLNLDSYKALGSAIEAGKTLTRSPLVAMGASAFTIADMLSPVAAPLLIGMAAGALSYFTSGGDWLQAGESAMPVVAAAAAVTWTGSLLFGSHHKIIRDMTSARTGNKLLSAASGRGASFLEKGWAGIGGRFGFNPMVVNNTGVLNLNIDGTMTDVDIRLTTEEAQFAATLQTEAERHAFIADTLEDRHKVSLNPAERQQLKDHLSKISSLKRTSWSFSGRMTYFSRGNQLVAESEQSFANAKRFGLSAGTRKALGRVGVGIAAFSVLGSAAFTAYASRAQGAELDSLYQRRDRMFGQRSWLTNAGNILMAATGLDRYRVGQFGAHILNAPGTYVASFFPGTGSTHKLRDEDAYHYTRERQYGDSTKIWQRDQLDSTGNIGFWQGALSTLWEKGHYMGVGNQFESLGYFGMNWGRVGDDLVFTKPFVQPGFKSWQASYATGMISMRSRGDLENFAAATNASFSMGENHKLSNLYTMHKKAAVVGKMFHAGNANNTLGRSGRQELRRRMELTAWALGDNNPIDLTMYFFTPRNGGKKYFNLGVPATDMGGSFKSNPQNLFSTSENTYNLFKAARDQAVFSGDVGEVEHTSADDFRSAYKGVPLLSEETRQVLGSGAFWVFGGFAALTVGAGILKGTLLKTLYMQKVQKTFTDAKGAAKFGAAGRIALAWVKQTGETLRGVAESSSHTSLRMSSKAVVMSEAGVELIEDGSLVGKLRRAMRPNNRHWHLTVGGQNFVYGSNMGAYFTEDPLAGVEHSISTKALATPKQIIDMTAYTRATRSGTLPQFYKYRQAFHIADVIKNSHEIYLEKNHDEGIRYAQERLNAVRSYSKSVQNMYLDVKRASDATQKLIDELDGLPKLEAEQLNTRAKLVALMGDHGESYSGLVHAQTEYEAALINKGLSEAEMTEIEKALKVFQKKITDTRSSFTGDDAFKEAEAEINRWLNSEADGKVINSLLGGFGKTLSTLGQVDAISQITTRAGLRAPGDVGHLEGGAASQRNTFTWRTAKNVVANAKKWAMVSQVDLQDWGELSKFHAAEMKANLTPALKKLKNSMSTEDYHDLLFKFHLGIKDTSIKELPDFMRLWKMYGFAGMTDAEQAQAAEAYYNEVGGALAKDGTRHDAWAFMIKYGRGANWQVAAVTGVAAGYYGYQNYGIAVGAGLGLAGYYTLGTAAAVIATNRGVQIGSAVGGLGRLAFMQAPVVLGAMQGYTGTAVGMGVAADSNYSYEDRLGAAQGGGHDMAHAGLVQSAAIATATAADRLGEPFTKAFLLKYGGEMAKASVVDGAISEVGFFNNMLTRSWKLAPVRWNAFGAAAKEGWGATTAAFVVRNAAGKASIRASAKMIGRTLFPLAETTIGAAMGVTVGLGIGMMFGSVGLGMLAGAEAFSLGWGGASIISSAFRTIASYVVAGAATDFFLTQTGLDKWIDKTVDEQAPHVVQWSNDHPYLSAPFRWAGAAVQGTQNWIDRSMMPTIERYKRLGNNATQTDRFWGGIFEYLRPDLINPNSETYKYYNSDGSMKNSVSTDPTAWHMSDGKANPSLMSLTPIFWGGQKDQINQGMEAQEHAMRGSAQDFLSYVMNKESFSEQAPVAGDSIVPMAFKSLHKASIWSVNTNLSDIGEASSQMLVVRAMATQHQLFRLMDRRDSWDSDRNEKDQRMGMNGYAAGYGQNYKVQIMTAFRKITELPNRIRVQDKSSGYMHNDAVVAGSIGMAWVSLFQNVFGSRQPAANPSAAGGSYVPSPTDPLYAMKLSETIGPGKNSEYRVKHHCFAFAWEAVERAGGASLRHGGRGLEVRHDGWGLDVATALPSLVQQGKIRVGDIIYTNTRPGSDAGSTNLGLGPHWFLYMGGGKFADQYGVKNAAGMAATANWAGAAKIDTIYHTDRNPGAKFAVVQGRMTPPSLRGGVSQWSGLAYAAGQQYGVDPRLIMAIIKNESNGNKMATSGVGAKGLMQLMPDTAAGYGVSAQSLYDPAQNLKAGVQFLRYLLQHYKGNVSMAVAAYNAGPGAVDKYGGTPPYKETINYVKNVMADYKGQGGTLSVNIAQNNPAAPQDPYQGLPATATGVETHIDPETQKILLTATYPDGGKQITLVDNFYIDATNRDLIDNFMARGPHSDALFA